MAIKQLETIKEKLKNNKIGEFFGKFSKKVKILIISGIIALIAIAVIIALVLNQSNYTVLFSGVSEEEATQIVGKLQESGVQYQYKGNGTILVDESVADQTRANLAYEGYPKSGFAYDIFTENAGGMTTDTEKQTYKLYELQNRIGATIGLFDGVKDAKVTIALKEEQKYALEEVQDENSDSSSASVVVTMDDGGSPTEKQAAAIQRLVAKSVPDMKLENVAVFDGNGLDVSVNQEGSSTSGDTGEEIAKLIEDQIARKVINVLSPFYGADNIRVSAKGQINMERVMRETIRYTTPEKIDEEDKRGIISEESISTEQSAGGGTTGGVAGSETNADVSTYTNTTGNGGSTYANESVVREYLVNQIKEQGELDPGVLEDLTVAVSVNGTTLGNLTEAEARSLVGNATGIERDDRAEKITIVAAPFYEEEDEAEDTNTVLQRYLPIGIAVLALLLLIGLGVFLLLRRRRQKLAEAEYYGDEDFIPVIEEEQPAMENPELLNLKSEKTRELRETVRAFADENPELSAQMLKTWLNGGDADGRSE